MKNIIAYSLWGEHPMYWKGALENIKDAKKYYPNFICRFYVDKKCNNDLIKSLISDNVEIVLVDSLDSFHGMFWRFNASCDPDVDIYLSRDCDSRITEREVSAVNEWLKSDKDFHIMRDHPYHAVPILGGMWGSRNGLMREIKLKDLILSWGQYYKKGIDQDFLGQKVYPLIMNRAFEHSEFGLYYGGSVNHFPSERKDYEFVGDVFDENNQRHPDYWKLIKKII